MAFTEPGEENRLSVVLNKTYKVCPNAPLSVFEGLAQHRTPDREITMKP